MRYVWDQLPAYFGPERVGAAAGRPLRRVLAAIARWDASTAHRVDRYVAISQYVAGRIGRYYNREASIVYPPVDTSFFHPGPAPPRHGCLIVSALVPYKRVDLGIRACAEAGAPLRIIGDGPDLGRLRKIAGPGVEFLGPVSDEEVRQAYRSAAAMLLPGAEDFGIAPVEAQACGCPVVALAEGGACEDGGGRRDRHPGAGIHARRLRRRPSTASAAGRPTVTPPAAKPCGSPESGSARRWSRRSPA